jgi:hypothetical protein
MAKTVWDGFGRRIGSIATLPDGPKARFRSKRSAAGQCNVEWHVHNQREAGVPNAYGWFAPESEEVNWTHKGSGVEPLP